MNAQKEPMAARELISGGSPEQIEARFPKLNDSQIAGLAAFGQQRDAQPHEVILERGDLHHGIFVVLSGRIEVLRVSDWYCCPHFDSPSVFGGIVDDKKAGRFQISADSDGVRHKQFYWPSTNVFTSSQNRWRR